MSEQLTNLRMQDLVAKTARVTLRDTVRVILAVKAVTQLYADEGEGSCELFDALSITKPTPENVAACEQASFILREGDVVCREKIDATLDAIKQFL